MAKADKSDVDYSEGNAREHCGNCAHYRTDGSCTKVDGHILARMWCRLYEAEGKSK